MAPSPTQHSSDPQPDYAAQVRSYYANSKDYSQFFTHPSNKADTTNLESKVQGLQVHDKELSVVEQIQRDFLNIGRPNVQPTSKKEETEKEDNNSQDASSSR
jgi:hypothetical protein